MNSVTDTPAKIQKKVCFSKHNQNFSYGTSILTADEISQRWYSKSDYDGMKQKAALYTNNLILILSTTKAKQQCYQKCRDGANSLVTCSETDISRQVALLEVAADPQETGVLCYRGLEQHLCAEPILRRLSLSIDQFVEGAR